MEVLAQLPEEGLAAPIEVSLPSSTLSGTFGKGTIVELSPSRLAVDGNEITAKDKREQLTELRRLIADVDQQQPVYIAAAWDLDVATLHAYLEAIPEQYELKLLFSVPPAPTPKDDAVAETASDLASAVLAERDVSKRHALADAGYESLAQCTAVGQALPSLKGLSVRERWPRVRALMQEKLPSCQCEELDADALRHLLVAEQRAGTFSLGSIPASFLRDRRCSAAMPMDSMQQVLDEIDAFDAEFAGDWKEDALVFDKVVTDDRLLVYMCVALPDETLAYVQETGAELFWRVPGSDVCQAWRFEQLAHGAPMGTWRRADPGAQPLAVHYRQGGSEIRLFGPVRGPESNPTDPGPWPCNEDMKLTAVSERGFELEKNGRWYFDRATCESAPASEARLSGCVANLAAGITPPPPVPEEGAVMSATDGGSDASASSPAVQ